MAVSREKELHPSLANANTITSLLTKQQLLAHNQLKLMSHLDRKYSLPANYAMVTKTTATTPKSSDSTSSTSSSSIQTGKADAGRRLEQKRGSLQLAVFSSTKQADNESDSASGVDNSAFSSTTHAPLAKHDKKRKKSLPGPYEQNSSENGEPVPYTIRRKFSNGQVKVRPQASYLESSTKNLLFTSTTSPS